MGIVAVDLKPCLYMGLVGLGAKHCANKRKKKKNRTEEKDSKSRVGNVNWKKVEKGRT